MPWTVKDVDRHKKGLTPEQKKKWVKIANSVLRDCQAKGGKDCEAKAIRIANSKFSEEKIPKNAFCLMDDNCFAKIKEEAEEDKLDMIAYSGGIIKNHFWWGDLVIDLEGMSFPLSKYPILENHDTSRKIGFTKKPVINGGIRIGDHVSFVDTEESREFRKLSKQGFPYQASIYAIPTVIERVEKGAEAEVNGMSVKGEVTIWRKSIFKEASVCVFGWDSNTRSTAFADEELDINIDYMYTGFNEPKQKEVNAMNLEELKKENPEAYDKLKEEVRGEIEEEIKEKFEKEKEKIIQTSKDEISKLREDLDKKDERILKLEKENAIRKEKDRQLEADNIWNSKLAESDIPEHLADKVKAMVSYKKFVKDDVFDVEAFTKAVEDEIKDWVDKGITSSIVLGMSTSSKFAGEEEKTKEQKKQEDDTWVNEMLNLSGQQEAQA